MDKFRLFFIVWLSLAMVGLAEPLKPGWVEHKLPASSSWTQLSELYGVSAELLERENPGLEPLEGVLLRIPPSTGWSHHAVIRGQTLWRIGKAYGIPVSELKQANSLTENTLLPGQRLILPRRNPVWSAKTSASKKVFGTRPALASRGAKTIKTRGPELGEKVQVTLEDGSLAWVESVELLLPSTEVLGPTEVLAKAQLLIGVPYRWGGVTPNGYDCSGFVQHLLAFSGHDVPRLADVQYQQTTRVTKNALKPGDLVFFNTDGTGISHVGLYSGEGRFIHASSSRGVMESGLDESYWAPRYVGGGRLGSWP